MRLATYNIEWMNSLFADDGTLLNDNERSGRHSVTRRDQIAALRRVFQAMDADGVMIIVAPDQGRRRDTVAALAPFAAHAGIRARRAVFGFANDTQQEIALLYDPDVLEMRHDPQTHPAAPQFDGEFAIDLDFDASEDRVVFSKPPLELAVETPVNLSSRQKELLREFEELSEENNPESTSFFSSVKSFWASMKG